MRARAQVVQPINGDPFIGCATALLRCVSRTLSLACHHVCLLAGEAPPYLGRASCKGVPAES
jgi:hypothetical protein